MEKAKATLKKVLHIAKKTVIFVVRAIDYCYNLLPLENINNFLSRKKIGINVKSKAFKYSLSVIALLLLLGICKLCSCDHDEAETQPRTTRSKSNVDKVAPAFPEHRPGTTNAVEAPSSSFVPPPAVERPRVAAPSPTVMPPSPNKPPRKQESVEDAAKRISLPDAAKDNRIDVIEYLLKTGKINVNQRLFVGSADAMRVMRGKTYLNADESASKDTLLMLVVRLKKYELAEFLLNKGADVNLSNDYGDTALHIAAKLNDVKLCEMMLKNNTTINRSNTVDETPLLIAVRNGSKPVIRLLRLHHARVPKTSGGKLLVELIEKNDIELAKVLCESGADVSYEVEQHSYGPDSEIPIKAPITLAVKNDNPDFVKYLLEKGASSTGKGKNYVGYRDFVHIYVASRHRPDILPLLPYNPITTTRMLCYAAYYGHIDVINFLLKQKCDINSYADFYENKVSPLQYLVDRCNPLAMAIAGRRYDAAKLLLDNGANPENLFMETFGNNRINISNSYGNLLVNTDWLNQRFDWLVKWRAGYCEPKLYDLLAEYGRAPRATDLFFAAAVGNSAIMDRLLQQGVKPSEEDAKIWGNYIVAVRPPNALKMLVLLLDKSVLPINATPNDDATLLMNAITAECDYTQKGQIDRKDMVSFLIDRGADVNIFKSWNFGQSALYYAMSKKKDDIIGILLAHKAKMTNKDADDLLRQARGSLPEYKYLLSHGFKMSVNTDNPFGEVCDAIIDEPFVIAKLVIENCENLNFVPLNRKETLLDYVEPRVKNKRIIKLMRDRGAKKYSELKHDAKEQYETAKRFACGDGVEKDPKMSAYWFARSANQGYAPAQYELANCYKLGIGVIKDMETAAKWYSQAAEQGYVQAQHELTKRKERSKRNEVVGGVLLPCKGEPREEYDIRLDEFNAYCRSRGSDPAFSYFTEFGKNCVIQHRARQKAAGIEPDGVEVKTGDGVDFYSRKAASPEPQTNP